MQKAVYKLIDKFIDGSDVYYYKDSLWIIFTDTKEWVIELTNKNTLWYNYRFFKQIFDFVSLDVVENQHYITKWVEDTIQNGVRHTLQQYTSLFSSVEDTIQNGVRHTTYNPNDFRIIVEDTIQNGVRHTRGLHQANRGVVEDTIRNGIKETKTPGDGDIESTMEFMNENNTLDVPKLIEKVITNTTGVKNNTPQEFFQYVMVNDTIQNGIKYTHENIEVDSDEIEDTIKNGIKETYEDVYHHKERINGVIRNGVKNTYSDIIKGEYDWRNQFKPDEVINNGRKL